MCINIPINNFARDSAEYVDFEIWSSGINKFNTNKYSKSSSIPHELDYLRGFHDSNTLEKIRLFLQSNLQSCSIRVMSVWLDKTA